MPVNELEEILADAEKPERSKLFWSFLKELYVGYHAHLEGETITAQNKIEFVDHFARSFDRFLRNTGFTYDPFADEHVAEHVLPDYSRKDGGLDLLDGRRLHYHLKDGRKVFAEDLNIGDVLADDREIVDIIKNKDKSIDVTLKGIKKENETN